MRVFRRREVDLLFSDCGCKIAQEANKGACPIYSVHKVIVRTIRNNAKNILTEFTPPVVLSRT